MTRAPALSDQANLTLTDHELASRLSWFISIRWFAAAATVLLALVAHHLIGLRFDTQPVIVALIVLLAYNALLALAVNHLQKRGTLTRRAIHALANLQVVCDLLLVAALWHFTGAVENAFGIVFVFPMVWAAELLDRRNAYLHAVLGAALLNAVAWGEYAGLLPHVHLVRETVNADLAHEFIREVVYRDWHRVFMVTFSLTGALFFTVYLAATIATRLRYREQQLEQTFRSLKSVDTLKTHFMRKASHELRAPLAAIHMLLETVLAGLTGKVDPKQEEMIRRAAERTDSLTYLINDLLRYSRLEAEAGVLVKLQPVSFTNVLSRTMELLTPSAEAKGLQLVADLHPAHVLADEEGLTELATNLISNAIRYSGHGKTVEIALTADTSHATLTVRDHGIGITAEDLPHVFEEFFRSEAAKKAVQHGTGMGLAIVKRLVETYDGSIDLESPPSAGATFTVRLPLAICELR